MINKQDYTFKEPISGNVLDKLSKSRIFSILLIEDNTEALFGEECDGCFGCVLTKKELGELISELETLHASMI